MDLKTTTISHETEEKAAATYEEWLEKEERGEIKIHQMFPSYRFVNIKTGETMIDIYIAYEDKHEEENN